MRLVWLIRLFRRVAVELGRWNKRRVPNHIKDSATWYGSGTRECRSMERRDRVNDRVRKRWNKW